MLLVLALLLCGCAQNTPEPTAPTENVNLPVDSAAGLYVPGSQMETATAGAVRAFGLRSGSCYDYTLMNGDLIALFNDNGTGKLTLYQGANLTEFKTVTLGENVLPTISQIQMGEKGIGYFDRVNNNVVFLSKDLVETGRVHLPEGVIGDAWLSPDWQNVYYCTAQGIHSMTLQTGIAHLLLEKTAFSQKLTGIFGNGQALRYELELTEGNSQTLLIDAATGVTLYENAALNQLETSNQQYFMPVSDRGVTYLRYGSGETHSVLWPAETAGQPHFIFQNNAAVMLQMVDCNTQLTKYDLATGKRTAEIKLPGELFSPKFMGDSNGGIWILSADGWLYHWNSTKNAVEDTVVYKAPWYTKDAPDEAGLAAIKERAKALSEKFSIDILIWDDAAKLAPADQFLTGEHSTQLYDLYLTKLEEALSVFPEGCFKKDSGGKLQIALVQKITGEPAWGTLAESDCIQYRKDERPVVALTMGDKFVENLYHGVYLYMETRLLSKSAALYEWFRINPSDFSYDNSYITNLDRTDTKYIEGKKPYFIDLFSMSYAKEDRATIFEYACMPGNEEIFKSSVLQDKLQRICKGIREAYGLKKVETPFLWEQYLT